MTRETTDPSEESTTDSGPPLVPAADPAADDPVTAFEIVGEGERADVNIVLSARQDGDSPTAPVPVEYAPEATRTDFVLADAPEEASTEFVLVDEESERRPVSLIAAEDAPGAELVRAGERDSDGE